MSGGLPELTSSILTGADHPLIPATKYARELIASSVYLRLTRIEELTKDHTLCMDTLLIMQQMAHISLLSKQGKQGERWQSIYEASYNAYEALTKNAQTKLVLINLMLQL